jgi:phage-related protein
MPFEVKILQPAADFLDALPLKLRAKAYRAVSLLKQFGPFLREPHAKKISGWQGLMELRASFGTDTCRLFYFWHRLSFYVVTSGYLKKDMKLERRELERAALLRERYLEESGE